MGLVKIGICVGGICMLVWCGGGAKGLSRTVQLGEVGWGMGWGRLLVRLFLGGFFFFWRGAVGKLCEGI